MAGMGLNSGMMAGAGLFAQIGTFRVDRPPVRFAWDVFHRPAAVAHHLDGHRACRTITLMAWQLACVTAAVQRLSTNLCVTRRMRGKPECIAHDCHRSNGDRSGASRTRASPGTSAGTTAPPSTCTGLASARNDTTSTRTLRTADTEEGDTAAGTSDRREEACRRSGDRRELARCMGCRILDFIWNGDDHASSRRNRSEGVCRDRDRTLLRGMASRSGGSRSRGVSHRFVHMSMCRSLHFRREQCAIRDRSSTFG